MKRNVPASLDLYWLQKNLMVLREHDQKNRPTAVVHYVPNQVVLRAVEVAVEVEKEVQHTREHPWGASNRVHHAWMEQPGLCVLDPSQKDAHQLLVFVTKLLA